MNALLIFILTGALCLFQFTDCYTYSSATSVPVVASVSAVIQNATNSQNIATIIVSDLIKIFERYQELRKNVPDFSQTLLQDYKLTYVNTMKEALQKIKSKNSSLPKKVTSLNKLIKTANQNLGNLKKINTSIAFNDYLVELKGSIVLMEETAKLIGESVFAFRDDNVHIELGYLIADLNAKIQQSATYVIDRINPAFW